MPLLTKETGIHDQANIYNMDRDVRGIMVSLIASTQ